MGISRVEYGENTLIDLTNDTVTAEVLLRGYTAHKADGEIVVGVLESGGQRGAALEPYLEDLNSGTIGTGVWRPESPTNTYADEYEVLEGHQYFLTLGGTVGNRFRVLFTTEEVSQATENISGTSITTANNPDAYSHLTYTATSDGSLTIVKTSTGVTGIKTYLYDMTDSWK